MYRVDDEKQAPAVETPATEGDGPEKLTDEALDDVSGGRPGQAPGAPARPLMGY